MINSVRKEVIDSISFEWQSRVAEKAKSDTTQLLLHNEECSKKAKDFPS